MAVGIHTVCVRLPWHAPTLKCILLFTICTVMFVCTPTCVCVFACAGTWNCKLICKASTSRYSSIYDYFKIFELPEALPRSNNLLQKMQGPQAKALQPENRKVKNISICSLCVVVLPTFMPQTFYFIIFALTLSSSGRSHVGSLFTNEEQ